MKMTEFTRQIRKTIISYLTLAFQNEMISEKCAHDMAIKWVNEHSNIELYNEYKRLTS